MGIWVAIATAALIEVRVVQIRTPGQPALGLELKGLLSYRRRRAVDIVGFAPVRGGPGKLARLRILKPGSASHAGAHTAGQILGAAVPGGIVFQRDLIGPAHR